MQTFPLSYAKGDALSPLLTKSALSPRGQIQVDTRTNTLIITDLPDRLADGAALIATLDKPQPQVEVEARVVQTTRDFARALGIQWGFNGRANSDDRQHDRPGVPEQRLARRPRRRHAGPGTGSRRGRRTRAATRRQNTATVVNLAGGRRDLRASAWRSASINGAFNLDVALTALENTGKGRILSTPRLTTQNNQDRRGRAGRPDSDSDHREQHGHGARSRTRRCGSRSRRRSRRPTP